MTKKTAWYLHSETNLNENTFYVDRNTGFQVRSIIWLASITLCSLLAGCETDVSIEIKHRLRSVQFENDTGTIRAQYHIDEDRVWQKWPCITHGCGDSESQSEQDYFLSWQLPARENTGSSDVPFVEVQADVWPEGTLFGSEESSFNTRVAGGVTGMGFTAEDRLGSWPVLEEGGSGCRRSLPCYVNSADQAHMLVLHQVYSVQTDTVVQDLSHRSEFASFVDAAIEQLSYRVPDTSTVITRIAYALANDLHYIVAYPFVNQCFPGEAQKRFNSIVVYDLETHQFETYLNQATAAEGLQPASHVQQVYFDDDKVHFVSRYARRSSKGSSLNRYCIDEPLMSDFNAVVGHNRPLDAAMFIAATNTSIEGTANYYTRFDFEEGVVLLNVFDIPKNARTRYRLVLPEKILTQVDSDRVRPGIINGEFVAR